MKEENQHSGFSTLLGQEFLVECHVIASLFNKKLAREKAVYFFPFPMCILKPRTHLFTGLLHEERNGKPAQFSKNS